MNKDTAILNESNASVAFSKQAPEFDELYGSDIIIQYKRQRVRDHVLRYLKPQAQILELNAGTGEDAVFFAQAGHTIHATDISEGMHKQLKEKINKTGLSQNITAEICSYTNLENLKHKGPYDLIFSNFAGLNFENLVEILVNNASLHNIKD